MNPEFIQVASLLGRSLAALENSQEVTSYSRIPDPQQFRKIMSRGTDLSRCRRGKTFFDAIGYRTRIGQGMHDRGEAYVFADADLCDADRRGLSNHFPVRLKSISVARKRLRAGQVWDVSTCGEDWGVDALEELYVLLNVGRLEVEPGAAILVQGNVFSFVCQELIHLPDESENVLKVLIRGTPHGVSTGLRDRKNLDGKSGENGVHGISGQNGHDVQLSSSVLGPCIILKDSDQCRDGQRGSDGSNGCAGERGCNGGMSKTAEITIRSFVSSFGGLIVDVQPGDGGNGGAGGRGGHGGPGGHGASGVVGLDHTFHCGKGGDGGNGGNGGDGGPGGNAGLSSNVYLDVQLHATARVMCVAKQGRPGLGGAGGEEGRAGVGGRPGRESLDALVGKSGRDGRPGRIGRNGKPRPGPPIFLNDFLQPQTTEFTDSSASKEAFH